MTIQIASASMLGMTVYNTLGDHVAEDTFTGSVTVSTGPNLVSATGIGANFIAGDRIKLNGSVLNTGVYTVTVSAANALTIAETPVAEGPLTWTVVSLRTYRWYPFTSLSFGIQQPVVPLPPESGRSIVPRSHYKQGVWGQGQFNLIPRLDNNIGSVFLAAIGSAWVSPMTVLRTPSFTGTLIATAATNTIAATGIGIRTFIVGDKVRIPNSIRNTKTYTVSVVGADSLTVTEELAPERSWGGVATLTVTANTIAGTGIGAAFLVGDRIKVLGAKIAGNQVALTVTVVTANSITVSNALATEVVTTATVVGWGIASEVVVGAIESFGRPRGWNGSLVGVAATGVFTGTGIGACFTPGDRIKILGAVTNTAVYTVVAVGANTVTVAEKPTAGNETIAAARVVSYGRCKEVYLAATDTTLTEVGTGNDTIGCTGIEAHFVAGNKIHVAGAAADNLGLFTINLVGANLLTVTEDVVTTPDAVVGATIFVLDPESSVHSFQFGTSEESIPYLGVRRILPRSDVANYAAGWLGEEVDDCRIGSIELSLPATGPLTATAEIVGRESQFEDDLSKATGWNIAETTYDNDDAFTLGVDEGSTVSINGVELPLTGAVFTLNNNMLPVDSARVTGSPYPFDFPVLGRSATVRCTVLVEDYALYQSLFSNSVTLGSAWSTTPLRGNFRLRVNSPTTFGASGINYCMEVFNGENAMENTVVWGLQGTLQLSPQQPIVVTLIGNLERNSYGGFLTATLQNGQTATYAAT